MKKCMYIQGSLICENLLNDSFHFYLTVTVWNAVFLILLTYILHTNITTFFDKLVNVAPLNDCWRLREIEMKTYLLSWTLKWNFSLSTIWWLNKSYSHWKIWEQVIYPSDLCLVMWKGLSTKIWCIFI